MKTVGKYGLVIEEGSKPQMSRFSLLLGLEVMVLIPWEASICSANDMSPTIHGRTYFRNFEGIFSIAVLDFASALFLGL